MSPIRPPAPEGRRPSAEHRGGRALLAVAVLAATACATAAPVSTTNRDGVTASGGLTPAQQAAADSGRPPYTEADVAFMRGMIGHHAQALVMAAMAESHGASSGVRTLAGRIHVGQRDEIETIRRWLADRRLPAPDPAEMQQHMAMGHAMGDMMPGMLTAEELAELDRARGAEFDRRFLTFMIRHHEGAVAMVHQLFSAHGAGQDITVFRFASDVEADQTTEIARMRLMLEALANR